MKTGMNGYKSYKILYHVIGCDFMEWKEQYPKSKRPNI
jgi:hypothetical protein